MISRVKTQSVSGGRRGVPKKGREGFSFIGPKNNKEPLRGFGSRCGPYDIKTISILSMVSHIARFCGYINPGFF